MFSKKTIFVGETNPQRYMAYQRSYKEKQIAHVMGIYNEWKVRNTDRPDTYFVTKILPKHGFFMCYSGFMVNYKARFLGKPYKRFQTGDKQQLSLFV